MFNKLILILQQLHIYIISRELRLLFVYRCRRPKFYLKKMNLNITKTGILKISKLFLNFKTQTLSKNTKGFIKLFTSSLTKILGIIYNSLKNVTNH